MVKIDDQGYDFREVEKLLTDRCLKNISETVILCTKTFDSRVMAMNSMGRYDYSREASKQMECCALWKWKDCLVDSVRSAPDSCDVETDLKHIRAFPRSPNSTIAQLFIGNYCSEYSENSENCGPFWTQWKIIVASVLGSVLTILLTICCADCVHYKYRMESRKKSELGENVNQETMTTRF